MNSIVESTDDNHISPQSLLNSLSGPAILVRRDGSIIRCNSAFLARVDIEEGQHLEQFLKSAQPSLSLVALVERSARMSGELPAKVQFKNEQGYPQTTLAYLSMVKSKLTAQPYAVLIQLQTNQNKVGAFLKRMEGNSDKKNTLILKAKEESVTDPLTGLKNRRAVEQVLTVFHELYLRNKTPCSLAILDIDHFKKINDDYGHQVGDLVLEHFSDMMKLMARESDTIGRWGGEEFIIVLPETNAVEAGGFVNRLLQAVKKVLVKADDVTVSFTFSAGVSQFRKGDTLDALIVRADEALYSAKESGRKQFRIRV